MRISKWMRFALAAGLSLWAVVSYAHTIRPAVVFIDFSDNGAYRLEIRLDVEALLAGLAPKHGNSGDSSGVESYEQLRKMSSDELQTEFRSFAETFVDGVILEFDGVANQPRFESIRIPPVGDIGRPRISTIILSGRSTPDWKDFGWRYAAEFGPSFLKFRQQGDTEYRSTWVQPGSQARAADTEIGGSAQPVTAWSTMVQYVSLGFIHIVPLGIDHVLFVLGLFLLTTRLGPLLIQVTAFTVAHTITLALTIYGVFSLSPAIVEPLIALSIVYVAIENVITSKLTVWRPFIVFGFGLLHGMGFAGVLRELGLPESQFLTALLSFNIGVEFGQLTVIASAFLAVGIWGRGKDWYRPRVVVPVSLAIALVGLFWTVQRVTPVLAAYVSRF